MYQQQSFHTSNYRGNQQGHDNYLRSDSQNASSFGASAVQSQYRGMGKTFQPTGYVQSVYGQNAQSSFGAGGYQSAQQPAQQFAQQSAQQFSQQSAQPSAQSYQTSNYRGNQAGHDNWLRSDASSPSWSSVSSGESALGSASMQTQSFQNQAAQSQFQPTSAFHASNYRGDQQGHDNYLRSDASSPSAYAGQSGFSSYSSSSFAPSQNQFYQSQPQNQYQSQSQFQPSSASFHTAGYRGNQQGHDSYLRSDASNPSGFGMASASSYRAF